MSSHHFVKEGQEPALFILDLPQFEIAGPLLEWAPLVIVQEKVLDEVLEWGIKLDVILTTPDKEDSLKHGLANQAPVKILAANSPEESLESALYLLINRKQKGVSILTKNPEQLFDSLKNFTAHIQIALLSEHERWVFVNSTRYEKWVPQNTIIKISNRSGIFRTNGLETLENHYKALNDGMVTLESEPGFWVGEL